FKEGFAAIKLNEKWGYIDKKGKMHVKPEFDFVSGFINGFSEVKLNDKWGLIDTKGEFFLKPEFDNVKQLGNAILTKKDGKYGIASFNGKFLEPQFDYIQKSYNQKIFLVEKDSKIGLVSKEAQIIVEPKFDKASYQQNGILQVAIGKKLGLFD
ncbi:TPA: WG repeat-containing protein, partial [Campylobacter coli]|nr:WG repeat-containing protein [Campylobacter coli]